MSAVEEYRADYTEVLEQVPERMGVDVTEKQIQEHAERQVEKIERTLVSGYDNGGIAKNIVLVSGIKKVGGRWYYDTKEGLYEVR